MHTMRCVVYDNLSYQIGLTTRICLFRAMLQGAIHKYKYIFPFVRVLENMALETSDNL